jgi:hypothetical protein
MNNNFEMNSLVGRELTEEELTMIQGGNIFGDIGRAVSNGVKAVGNAIAGGAKAIANGFANEALAEIKRRLFHWF